jgi:hypothetical protein
MAVRGLCVNREGHPPPHNVGILTVFVPFVIPGSNLLESKLGHFRSEIETETLDFQRQIGLIRYARCW